MFKKNWENQDSNLRLIKYMYWKLYGIFIGNCAYTARHYELQIKQVWNVFCIVYSAITTNQFIARLNRSILCFTSLLANKNN
jgi:hypothetical protein